MEPITILIIVSTIFIIIIWTLLSIILFKFLRIINKVTQIIDYIDHIRDLLQTWESIPIKFITKIIKRIFW